MPDASPRFLNAFPVARTDVDSFGNPITPRTCCGCRAENDPRRTHCLRCRAILPQLPGVHFLRLDRHPVPIPYLDRSEDDPFYRTAVRRQLREDYRRRWGG